MAKPRRAVTTVPTLLVLAATGAAQNLVRDLVPPSANPQHGSPQRIVDRNGIAIFAATSGHGQELWRSDGTVAGTYLVKDINPGSAPSSPSDLLVAGNYVFFTATVLGLGRELWRTDGTAAGTMLLRDGVAGQASGAPTTMAAFGSHLYFAGTDATNGTELWRSDGTVAGTTIWKDINPGAVSGLPALLTVGGGSLFFAANQAGSSIELWRSDGTLGGTTLVKDVSPGSASTSFLSIVGSTGGVFFHASEQSPFNYQLYFSDGTPAGTHVVRDIGPGAGAAIADMTAFGAGLLFAADDGTTGSEPWYSDGTFPGTVPLGDLYTGLPASAPGSFAVVSSTVAVFAATHVSLGRELFVTNGTAAGTSIIEIAPGASGSSPARLTSHLGRVLFAASTPSITNELWSTDGTAAGTVLVRDIYPGPPPSSPQQLARVGGQMFFAADNGVTGVELWKTDGTNSGTVLVADLYLPQGDSNPTGFRQAANAVVFGASAVAAQSPEVWGSDGTVAGTVMLDLGAGWATPQHFVNLGSQVYASAIFPTVGREILVTDGTQLGTQLAVDVSLGGSSSAPGNLAALHGKLWFSATEAATGYEPYVSNGTPAGTLRLADITAGSNSSAPNYFAAAGTRVVFAASGEPWVSDGTTAGTLLLQDLWVGPSGSSPGPFLSVGNLAYFAATSSAHGNELFVTDGTPAGTQNVYDLQPGAVQPNQLVALANGTIVFVGSHPTGGAEPYRSNGTAAGTSMIGQVVAGSAGGQIQDMVAVGNLAFFTADDGATGRELWMTDGLTVTQVKDIYPGQPSGVLVGTLRARTGTTEVVFAGADGNDGLQVWVSDGTALGTHQVGKIGPWAGSGAVDLGEFTTLGTDTWFWCDEGITGREPWRISITGVVASVSTYGNGCPGTGNLVPIASGIGLPRLGNSAFGLQVTNGRPFSLAVYFLSTLPSNVPIGTCHVLIGQPIVGLPGTVTDVFGTAATPFPIPVQPSLAGLAFYGQWLVLDDAGALLGLGSLSNGMTFVVGN